MVALLGGMAIVATATMIHRPERKGITGEDENGGACPSSAPAPFCDEVEGLSRSLRNPAFSLDHRGVLPPPEVPGAVDPRITQERIDQTICRPGYARSVRPAYAITGPLKRRMMDAQHPHESMADYELDHLIPISLGGAPLDARDLWLQPRLGQANAGDKNVLAYVLWRLVCTHQLSLGDAQRAIRRDWTKAYETYATPHNVARYHFLHPADDSG